MKTKEEIFEHEGIGSIDDIDYTGHVANAMDLYAKEIAIEYLCWVNKTYIKDEKLFELFKKENNI